MQSIKEDARAMDDQDGPNIIAKTPTAKPRFGSRFGLMFKLVLVTLVAGIAALWVIVPNRALPVPLWAVVQVEERLNQTLQRSMPGANLALEGASVTFARDFTPRLALTGVQLLRPTGGAILTLPEVQLTLAAGPLLSGNLRPRSLRVIGADLSVTRDAAGALDVAFAVPAQKGVAPAKPKAAARQSFDLEHIFAASDAFLASPLAAGLHSISAEGVTLRLNDLRLGRTWQLGAGLDIKHRDGELGGEVQFDLIPSREGQVAGRVVLGLIAPKSTQEARITMRLDAVDAGDFGGQFAPLAWLALLDAPLSGQLSSTVTPQGISALSADFAFGKGALQPNANAEPIGFDSAKMQLAYNPETGRVMLDTVQIQSAGLQFAASGHGDLLRGDGSQIAGVLAGERPSAVVAQLQVSKLRITQTDLFDKPVSFGAGAMDLRLRLDPFSLEIGQLSLVQQGSRLVAHGRADIGAQGWQGALDVNINKIGSDQLLAVWPKTLLPGTRIWLDKNLLAASLTDFRAALRVQQSAVPIVDLGFKFADGRMTVMPSLPEIQDAAGYGTIAGKSLTVVFEQGKITPPKGGEMDVAGSVYAIKDMSLRPNYSDITLKTNASVTSTLSLLDQKPFLFLTKAGRAVDLGTGRARLTTQLRLPLKKLITMGDVTYSAQGEISDFTSDSLVPSRPIAAQILAVRVDRKGLEIEGQGTIAQVPFDALYRQGFGAGATSQINGSAQLSDTALRAFGITLPEGSVTGAGTAQVVVDLLRGAPGKLTLTSDLNKIGLAIPEMGWKKPAASTGTLRADIILSQPPVVEMLDIRTADLHAKGRITMRAAGGLERADLADFTVGKWLDGALTVSGNGAGKPISLRLTSGGVDMRHLPPASARKSGGSGGAVPLSIKLDRLRVSDGISLTGVEGDFQLGAGVRGNFVGRVDGGPPIQGQTAPQEHGTGVRITAQDAGAVLSAAGIYTSARGGALDLTLVPRATSGHYDGQVEIGGLRVQNASALAELLNAISVVGLLDQLGGEGILFNKVNGQFVLTPNAVEVRDGAATGASLGVTMGGVYNAVDKSMNMQGTISPVYLLNGVGEVFTKRGEGVVGFNYTLRGSADAPDVGVDPLSVLTPGFLRDLFRRPTPKLKGLE